MARRRTAQLDLDGLAQLRWSDLAPELQECLLDLLADLVRQVAVAPVDVAEVHEDD